jgi:hypothetical protein
VVNFTSRPLYPRERPGTRCIGGWVCPRAGLNGCGKSHPHRDSIPGPDITLAAIHIYEVLKTGVSHCSIPSGLILLIVQALEVHTELSLLLLLLLLLLLGPGCYCPRKYCSIQAYCTTPALKVPACTARSPHVFNTRDL